MLSQSLQPPFQLQSILKQTHINMQDQPHPCKKRKKTSNSCISASAPSSWGKGSRSASHSCWQRDVMVLVRLYPNLLLYRRRASQQGSCPSLAV